MEELLKHFEEDIAKQILEIKAGDVTYEMLSDGQRRTFIGITKLIDRCYNPKKQNELTPEESMLRLLGKEKKHVVVNGPAGT